MQEQKINNVIRIPTTLSKDFFRLWLEFLSPYHNMTNREKDVASLFLRERYNLSPKVKDDEILDGLTLGEEIRRKIRQELNITNQHFQVIINKIKKAGFIKDKRINPKFIPKNLKPGDNGFQLLFYFDFDGDHIKQSL